MRKKALFSILFTMCFSLLALVSCAGKTSDIPSYYVPIVENVQEQKDVIADTFYRSNVKWIDTGISSAGGHYDSESLAWNLQIDGKTYAFSDSSIENPANYEAELAGVFAISGTERICAVFSDFAPILNNGIVTGNPSLVFLDFDQTLPADYSLAAFYPDDLDASYAWVDNCYLLGNNIYIASRDKLCTYELNEKDISVCTEEYQAANDIAESISDEFPAGCSLCNFLAVYMEDDIVVYQGDIADGFDAPALALIYVAFQNGQCVSDLCFDLRSECEPIFHIR